MKSVIILICIQGVLVKDVLLMTTKTWLRNINFNNSLNWDLGRVPCSQDNVIFPKGKGFVVQLPEGETILRQLVLPLDGEILLPLNGKLQLSKPNDKSDKCQGNDIVFSLNKISSWVDRNSWSGHSSATPDLEAIPCPTDKVIFPAGASFRVVMPDTPIWVAALSIAGKQLASSDWSELMSSDEGVTQFFTAYGRSTPVIRVTGESCSDITGCECNNEQLREEVWALMRKQCRSTPCLNPVTPYGNFCPICGAYMLFNYNEQFSKSKLEKYLDVKLSNENVDYHVSKVHGKIQIVLLERESYKEKVKDLADDIREAVKKRSDLGLELAAEFTAGALVSPPSFTRQAFIFIGFMLVAVCTVAVLFYLYTDIWKLNESDRSQYGFVTFENQTEGIEFGVSTNATRRTSKRQAFDNPMYGSTDEAEQKDQDNSEDCPIYDMLEEIMLEKEDFEDVTEEDPKTSHEK